MTPVPTSPQPRPFLNIPPGDWPQIVESLGEAPYRIQQIADWIFNRRVKRFQQMTDLPQGFRQKLEDGFLLRSLTPAGREKSQIDGTTRYFFTTSDGASVPCVYLPFQGRHSLCLSTQVGCAWGCVFCASGKVKFQRNLTVQEICDQIFFVEELTGHKLDSLLFMGMGEPLSAYTALLSALHLIRGSLYFNFGARYVTVSTCGLVPQIEKLAQEAPKVNLAISLHAAYDDLRKTILPNASKWTIKEVISATKLFSKIQKTKVTFEYILLDGVNDSEQDAKRLANLLRNFVDKGDYHVNLIAYNPIVGLPFQTSPHAKMSLFEEILRSRHIPVFLRKPQGTDIQAGCGQLGD